MRDRIESHKDKIMRRHLMNKKEAGKRGQRLQESQSMAATDKKMETVQFLAEYAGHLNGWNTWLLSDSGS